MGEKLSKGLLLVLVCIRANGGGGVQGLLLILVRAEIISCKETHFFYVCTFAASYFCLKAFIVYSSFLQFFLLLLHLWRTNSFFAQVFGVHHLHVVGIALELL